MKREGREKGQKSVNIKNNKCYKQLYENWKKKKEKDNDVNTDMA